ncbi:fibronectin-binding SSURE repeat-containing protein [Streptococcus gordonii]|uniref:SSURE domain-containing protein n=1 Tax=Streptococcus gordonii TaxID=1302 RepID=UPI001CBFE65B|nr:fibronectin-binding SSURE repeat-containing protein [Streptococcus gordonii]MBZ2136609.1 fibronectin-binding SSURE repeat-containing protein [Streptococcus gordonii]MCY7130780.1 fibronectin-binding SSURE repeat-containing protein [Streptococcus gordonii]MCY7141667.1 fibronectin-binding SSURE repeat-containing protein [Streptococcus gordonii]
MKFNTNQKYTRWSIRRLSVGVASVVVASGFFLLVGQPNTVHADDLTSTPTKVLQEDSSLLEKNKLPETALKEEMDSALPANQSAPKEEVDETISLDKSSLAPKEEVVKPKEEQTIAEVSNQKEEAKPEATLVEVSNQDREATTSQSVTTPDEVRKGVEENTKDSVDVPASYLEKANVPGPFLAGVNQVIPYEAFGGDGMLTRLLLKSSDKAPWSDNGKANNPALLPLEGLAKGQYFYEVDLNGNTTGKDGQALLDQLRINGTHDYQATVKVYGAKDGKPDSTNLVATKNVTVSLNGLVSKESVKDSVINNIKDHIDVPASYLEKANVPGPFLAGVNQVIPYEAFGGDGMLTRLLLKASDKAPWSDNGTANNPALLPLEGLAKGQYFYEVDLNGNTTGKDGQALLDQLRANGTHTYQATVKVYGAKDGKADLSNLVATKNVTVDMNGLISKEAVKDSVTKNIKDHIDVPASYLEKANVPGPFLAGVNQVIPYEAFGGDGMLTRLLLKSSDKAPWSDNGSANNPALLPLEGLAKGQYFYEVDLNGNTTGKDGQALLNQLRTNGTYAYQATVKVYGAKDGKADLTNLVATKNVTVSLNGLVSKEAVKDSVTKNIKDHIDVPASYLEKANVPGPFLAGVNQVIPYEAFGGDGMLTRLLLKASDKAPWSDNGSAKNPALLPLEGLAKGQYFYEVDLNGNTTGKDGQALLDQLRANGTRSYQATVKVYGAKDGKPDLTNLIATRQVTIQLRGKEMATIPSQEGQMNMKPSTTDSMSTAEGTKEVDHRMTDVKGEHPTSKPMTDMVKKNDKASLPETGEAQTATATIGFFGLALAGILGFLGLKEKQKD